ncbi:MAG: chemotaxis protein CheV [Spongiibacteraceae bacterium]|jgi:two-component system chemotaxis response regulator CheV|nr:chemotaxis protein CheV [Spongiibacteraceae bacterium]
MAGLMDSVNSRTQLVGQNRLELLLFRLEGEQVYGINVFKVREVLPCPNLTQIPRSRDVVRGVAHIRGGTIPVLDLGRAIGKRSISDLAHAFVIISEYNNSTQGFAVRSVERIVNLNWGDIHPPPAGAGRDSYLTAVTEVDGRLVEIIDVEKVLAEVSPGREAVSPALIEQSAAQQARSEGPAHVLVVDDSAIARKQIKRCLEAVGVQITLLNDGRQALEWLKEQADSGKSPPRELLMMISDIEMPEMDGYTLTAEVRNDPRLAELYILLHTSLSGVFNQAMVKKVGADEFLPKFNPDRLVELVLERAELVASAELA